MLRVYGAILGAVVVLAGPAVVVAAYGEPPLPIEPTDLRGAAAKVHEAVASWDDEGVDCRTQIPGVEVLWCARGLTSGR